MSNGAITIGSPSEDFYYIKTWSGSNGKGQENPYTMNSVFQLHRKSLLANNPSVDPEYYASCGSTSNLAWDDNHQIALLGKVSDEIRGHSFNLAVAAGEGRETIAMLGNVTSAFAKSVRSLKKGDGSGALKALGFSLSASRLGKSLDTKNISSTWLSIQYGWKPLLNDLYESSKAYEVLTSKPRKKTFYVSKTIRKDYDASASPSNWSCIGKDKISRQLKVTMQEQLSAPRSLGLLNPLSVAWELVPFSFVADWFIPIGTYIDTLAIPPADLNYTVTQSTFTRRVRGTPVVINTNVYDTINFSDLVVATSVVRETNVNLSPPMPKFNDFHKSMTQGRVKNALALVHQVFL